jgi:UDP-glucose 4-epimerase
MKHILVTGGAGYIGSHTCVALSNAGYKTTILDNLCNARLDAVDRLTSLCAEKPDFVQGDIRDKELLEKLFKSRLFSSVIHFAGLKAVGESNSEPLRYFENNIAGTLELLRAMQTHGPRSLVFSSSATVYGDPQSVPIKEDAPTHATNPYGRTKLMIEEMLSDIYASNADWRIARLRYFNPVGAHESGLIGEDPLGVPNNLMPFVAQVAAGLRPFLNVWGADYETVDGTGVRDYIHVLDLAQGHLAALQRLEQAAGMLTVNLGTGQGYSVLQMVSAFERASGIKIPYQIGPRRLGDVAICYADPGLANKLLGWRAQRNLDQMCKDAWNWQISQKARTEKGERT